VPRIVDATDPNNFIDTDTEVAPVIVEGRRTRPRETAGTKAAGLARAAASGLLFDFADEGEAAIRAAMQGKDYATERDRIRQANRDYAKAHPKAAMAANIAGAILPVGLTFLETGGASAAPLLGKLGFSAGKTLVPRMGLAAAEGGVQGATQAVGALDDKSGWLPAALTGGGAGLAGGAVMNRAGALVAAGGNALRRGVKGVSGAEDTARRVVNDALRRDADEGGKGVLQTVEDDINRNRPTSLADAGGHNVQTLAEVTALTPGEKPAALVRQMADAQAGSRSRGQALLAEQVAGPKSANLRQQEITTRLRNTYGTMYGPAFARGEINDPAIQFMLQLPEVDRYWSRAVHAAELDAQAAAAKSGKPVVNPLRRMYEPKLDSKGNHVEIDGIPQYRRTGDFVPTVQALDYLKRGMDEGIEAGFKRNGTMSSSAAANVRSMRDGIVNRLDELVPEYKAARAGYAGEAEVRDAIEIGAGQKAGSVAKMTVPDLLARVKGDADAGVRPWSQAEKVAVRESYGDRLMNGLSKSGNWAGNILRGDDIKKLEALYDDPAEFNVLRAALEREDNMFTSRARTLGGSPTGRRLVAKQSVDDAIGQGNWDAIPSLLSMGTRGGIISGAMHFLKKMNGNEFKPAVYEHIAEILRKGTPEEITAALKEVSTSGAAHDIVDKAADVLGNLGTRGATSQVKPKSEDPEAIEGSDPPLDGNAGEDTIAEPDPLEAAVDAFIPKMASHEGTGDNPDSTAVGPYQFVDDTFVGQFRKSFPEDAKGLSRADILAMRGHGLEDLMVKDFTMDNARALQALKLPVNDANLYLMHFGGEGGGPDVLTAPDDVLVASVLGPKASGANRNIEYKGKKLKDLTVGEFKAWAAEAMAAREAKAGA
jgi:hypothetical protein